MLTKGLHMVKKRMLVMVMGLEMIMRMIRGML